MSIYDEMSPKELNNEMKGWEEQVLEDTDKTLIRVFRRAVMECVANGKQDELKKWQELLRQAEEL